MMRHKALKAGIAAALAAGGIFATSQAAFAYVDTAISRLNSPNSYGYYSGILEWTDSTYAFQEGNTCDVANDGHGPYTHMIAGAAHGSYQFAYEHMTSGAGACVSTSGGDGYVSDSGGVFFVDVWECNGGTIAGYGVEGGCYGRRYWNQVTYPGRGSESLGTTTGTVY